MAPKRLASYLMYLGETEMQIEFSRQKLCRNFQFEPYACFQRIDRQAKGYITPRDVLKYIR